MNWGFTEPMGGDHRKSCKRYDVAGDAHFLTFSCFHRLPLLSRDRTCHWMLQAIASSRGKAPFDLWAYVLMPEHVHLVILPRGNARISSILRMKSSVSKRAISWLKRHGPEFLEKLEDVQPNGDRHYRFWQRGGGYDRNLRTVHDIHEKIRYVHENPVRRGLVERAVDWKCSSAHAWASGVHDPIPIDRDTLAPLTVSDDWSTSRPTN
jgi:putative transposase